MSIADELRQLEQLRQSGAVTEEEYQQAKKAALASAESANRSPVFRSDFWGRATVWTTLLHLSIFMGYLIPLAGFVAPIVLWQSRKEDPLIDLHGRIVMNALLSFLVWLFFSLLLVLFLVGVPMLYLLGILVVAFPIIGAIKAAQGRAWEYPLTFRFFQIPPVPPVLPVLPVPPVTPSTDTPPERRA